MSASKHSSLVKGSLLVQLKAMYLLQANQAPPRRRYAQMPPGLSMACLLIQSANLAISRAYNLKRFLIDGLSGGGSFKVKGDV